MSFTYRVSGKLEKDPLSQAILYRGTPLVVASAGNHNETIEPGSCNRLPPCLSDRAHNLIIVTAVDNSADNPKPLEYVDVRTNERRRSNTGPWVHVAAPGENVLGAITGNMVGNFSGTSQSTPQVTSVAAMIWAKLETISAARPEEVRDRIVISSDLFDHLPSSMLLGGRLNAGRALELDRAIFEIETGLGARQEILGNLVSRSMKIYFVDKKTSLECGVRLRNVLRLHRNIFSGTYEIILKSKTADRNFLFSRDYDDQVKNECDGLFPPGKLIRRRILLDKEVLEKGIKITQKPDSGSEQLISIAMSKITDYVAAFKH